MRTRNPIYLRAAKFWGKIFLINFAMGVVTGLVQEFQFGMNWSSYSRFVGDVFGAPLAMESLLAFFLESTFIGIWIFGWDKLSPALHAACIWLVAIGTTMSAFFILAANSFMQHPVGITVNADRDRAEMNDIWAVLTQPLNIWAYSHVIAGAILSGAAMFAGISSYFLMKQRDVAAVPQVGAARAWSGMLIGAIATLVTGDLLAKVMTDVQPMKMAAAEALWEHQCAGVVLDLHHRQPGRLAGGLLDPGAGRALVHGHRVVHRRGRGHQRCPGRSSRRGTDRATTGRTSR